MEFDAVVVKQEYDGLAEEKNQLLEGLKAIIIDSNVPLEGNSFYYHNSLNLFPELYSKQVNLFWCGKQASAKICEIGFNAGHSAMLMLLGRQKTELDFTVFDIGGHAYTKPTLDYIMGQFQHVRIEYIEGDSTLCMPAWIAANPAAAGTYDVVHVDGGHSEHCISNDFKHADILVKTGGIVLVDDSNSPIIHTFIQQTVLPSGKYREMGVIPTSGYEHRVFQKL